MFDLGEKLDRRWLWLIWLFPLLPLVWESDATALLWLGSTAFALLFIREARRASLAFVYRNWAVSIAIGLGIGTIMGLVTDAWVESLAEAATGTLVDLSQFANVEGDAGEYLALLLLAILFGGVVEEICFRGFFIGWGSRLFGASSAPFLLVLTSVIFGIGHWYQGPAGAISTGVSGLIFGIVYIACERKLLPAIVTHATANFWGVTAIYLYGV